MRLLISDAKLTVLQQRCQPHGVRSCLLPPSFSGHRCFHRAPLTHSLADVAAALQAGTIPGTHQVAQRCALPSGSECRGSSGCPDSDESCGLEQVKRLGGRDDGNTTDTAEGDQMSLVAGYDQMSTGGNGQGDHMIIVGVTRHDTGRLQGR